MKGLFSGALAVSFREFFAFQRSKQRKTCIRESHWKGLTFHENSTGSWSYFGRFFPDLTAIM